MFMPDSRQAEVHIRERMSRLRSEAQVERLAALEAADEPKRRRSRRPLLGLLYSLLASIQWWRLR